MAVEPAQLEFLIPDPATLESDSGRVQTGVRLEERLLMVLKALAEHRHQNLGLLVDDLVATALAGESVFDAEDRDRIDALCDVYELSHPPVHGWFGDRLSLSWAAPESPPPDREVTRVQSGLLMDRKLLKMVKTLALVVDRTLGEALEEIAASAFTGRPVFGHDMRQKIVELRRVFDLPRPA